ncbi:hypothetical protein DDB_G0272742 [Dictyostelium discoideum AX4]|uniref:Uncharacterized protein n=1 Tax=Dictyostelium discoideum TaxID=44689 RepID=Q7KWP5_DICDI|nr:hypothetical protein DDB_G0272742 [Dictyostelium discoideum AX4]EAL71008.1 hypothetical protein DDB_G0272742 [Dictyostelium discoideum AX4]|eukprot:XP_644986.1 hypothetical protein DDB_G0272742 [Dictyostelium discoideum AX4]
MKKYSLLILILFINCSFSKLTEIQYRNEFTAWMTSNQRTYASSEFTNRYNTFKSNLDFINQWNSKGSKTVLALNEFADISNEEYRKNYLRNDNNINKLSSLLINDKEDKEIKSSSSSGSGSSGIDWRKKGAVPSVKSQIGGCGSWPITAVGATESAHFLANPKDPFISLSMQNLIDCSNLNKQCYQGTVNEAFQYIIENGGIDSEESYKFSGGEPGKCKYNSSNSVAKITSYEKVKSGSESSLESAVSLKPVAAYIDASLSSFQFYSSGIYYEPSCNSTDLNHSILIVGFSDFSTTPTDSLKHSSNYWIVQNSFGKNWGENGYIFMSKDRDDNCGISKMASYVIV